MLSTTTDGKVSVKCIAKTFASGKTEKLVYDSLASLDLPSGKVSCKANFCSWSIINLCSACLPEWLHFHWSFHIWKVLSYLQNHLSSNWYRWVVCFNVSIFPIPWGLFSHLFFSTKTETISMPKFIDFMNDKQRDPRLNEILFPPYSEKRCMEIINKYEPIEENKTNSKFSVIFKHCASLELLLT